MYSCAGIGGEIRGCLGKSSILERNKFRGLRRRSNRGGFVC